MKLRSDAVKAYALNKANQADAARRIVQAWKNVWTVQKERLSIIRRSVPNGTDVSKHLGELMKS